MDQDYDEDGNNIFPCPICLNRHCPSKEDGKCPEEDEFVKHYNRKEEVKCLHDQCPLCFGSGKKKDGTYCIHGISCPCPKHSVTC